MTYTLPQSVHLGREVCGNLEIAEQHEWWLANGKGGYAGGNIAGTLTRRYHGLLIAPSLNTMQRHLLFAKADAELLDGERITPLHTNRWGSGAIEPCGHLDIESFYLDGRMPVWHYRVDDLLIEARIWMEYGRHTTCLAWKLLENPERRQALLRVRLLTNMRDHHGTTGFTHTPPSVVANEHEITVTHHDCCRELKFHTCCGALERTEFWVEDFDLPAERERGLPDRDRHYCIGTVTFPLSEGHWVGLTASTEADEPPYYMMDAMRRFQACDLSMLARAKVVVPDFWDAPDWINQLILAADSFVIRINTHAGGRDAIVAGYPWFGEWGRDSMIALPGLLLATGRFETARNLLLGYLPLLDRGMLPNYFPNDDETPEFNTVDASLWYIEAWRAYIEATRDIPSLAEAWPRLQQIGMHYREGTRYGIAMDPADGLLRSGEPEMQLTWMDAKINGVVITPRTGKPVEVNALWYNALKSMAWFARRLRDEALAREFARMAENARAGFQRYVREDGDGLLDVLDGPDGRDERIRPNQLFAVSLSYSPLDHATQRAVVKICRDLLLTPFGLRTLAPGHPDYHGRLQGGVWERDSAYHQGTVWAWLLGHFALAEYRVYGDAERALRRLDPLREHLGMAGMGTISEVFDGDAPHTPRGAPSQAWSVACTLDAWRKLSYLRTKIKKESAHEPIAQT